MENLLPNRRKVIDELRKGRECASQLQELLSKNESESELAAENLMSNILSSFSNTLLVLACNESEEVSKMQGSWISPKSEDSEESCKSIYMAKDRRGCYKRRRSAETLERDTPIQIDDGHAWRKYGQKVILKAKFPRCTHKTDQNCQATKQVQKIQEDPTLYRTTYYGQHTCRNFQRAPEIILDSPNSPSDTSMLLSFDTAMSSKQDQHPFFSSFPSIKQEGNHIIKEDHIPKSNDDYLVSNQSSSSDYLMSSDLTTFQSSDHGDVISDILAGSIGQLDDVLLQQLQF
ncbi:WRKY transcription factor [Quillaja saponaria]|uniref:WRKY transcription factor n=1 Tax=Quillaja saponaria TaxID=32244 RepID=A0AAD7LNC5_QUISA|nr:WRKY transcription factor [Quillaja saponaria]